MCYLTVFRPRFAEIVRNYLRPRLPHDVGILMASTSAQRNKELVRNYFEAWDAGDPAAISKLFADDFTTTYTNWTGEEVIVKPADVHDWIAGWLAVIDEMTHEIHALVAEDDQVMVQITYRGVHDGEVFGIEPTGTRIEVQEYLRFRIENTKIVEFDWLGDDLSLLRQLGVDLPTEPS